VKRRGSAKDWAMWIWLRWKPVSQSMQPEEICGARSKMVQIGARLWGSLREADDRTSHPVIALRDEVGSPIDIDSAPAMHLASDVARYAQANRQAHFSSNFWASARTRSERATMPISLPSRSTGTRLMFSAYIN
jgi:hypothetical protein